MTPEQKLKYAIIAYTFRSWEMESPVLTSETIDAEWDRLRDGEPPSGQHYYLSDAMEDIRTSGEETGLKDREYSRHYESDEVATQAPDGSWVGWTYWHGGGKHGDPSGIDWMESAYDLTVTEKEQTVIVRNFAELCIW